MMRRVLQRLIAGVLSVLATVLGVTLAALIFIACTETGLRLAWPRVQALLPAGIEIGAVEGRLIGPLTLRDIDIHGKSRDIRLDSLSLHWRPRELLNGVLHVESLTLKGLHVTRLPGVPEPPPTQAPMKLPERYSLPVRLRVDKLSVVDAAYRSAPGAEPVVIRHAELAAGAGPDGAYLRDIAVVASLFDLHGHLSVVPAGAYPVDGELSWHLRPPGYAEAAGETRLGGSLRELHVTQSVAAPYDIDARAVIRKAIEDPHFDIDLGVNGMQLAKIRSDLQPITLNVDSHLAGSVDAASYTLKARVQTPDYGTLHADSKGDYRSQVLRVHSLLLTLEGAPTRVTGHGQVAMGGTAPAVDAVIDWRQARWPLHGEATVTSPQGQMRLKGPMADLVASIKAGLGDSGHIDGRAERHGEHIAVNVDWRDLTWPLNPPQASKPRMRSPQGSLQMNGTLADYRLQLAARVDVPGQTGGHVRVGGRGDRGSVALDTIDIETLRGRIQGHARAAWKPALAFDAKLSGRGIDPGVLLPEWPGRVDFRVDAEGKRTSAGLRADVHTLTASGRLRGQPLRVNAQGSYAAGGLELARLDAALGNSRVRARGHVGKTLNLSWDAHSDDLAKLLPQLAGSLDAEGRVRGTVAVPRVSVTASGRGLSYADYSLKSFKLNADVDMSGANRSHVVLSARDGDVAGTELRSLDLRGEGVPRDHDLKLTAHSSRGDADLELHGDYHDTTWAFRLDTARVSYPQLAPWTLAAPAEGLVSRDHMRLSRACWTSGDAQLCAQGERGEQGVQGAFELERLGFGYFAALLPSGLAVTGSLDAHGRFRQPRGGEPSAQLQLTTTAGDVATTAGGATATVVGFDRSRMSLSLDDNGLRMEGGIELTRRGRLRLSARIPGGSQPLKMRPLSGRVSADIDDIGFISDLVPQIGRISGRLHGDMRVSGSIASPRILGQLTLADAAATLNGPGVKVTDIRVELAGRQSGAIHIQASARSGGGTLKVDGEANLAGRGPRVSLRIQGNAFQVFNTDDGHVWVSPDLTVRVRGREIHVNGKVLVPRARITPQQLPESAVTVSDDQVIVHPGRKGRSTASSGYKIYAKVRLILGKDVHVEAFGLKGRLGGELLVSAVPGEPTKGSGELGIEDGEYRAYGQGLVIQRGRILFPGGPIDQPGVDVRAIRRPAEDVLVGVQVRGNLKHPDFSLFSDPDMTQAEQLSWLVLGKSLEGTSTAENSAITRAALALGLQGGSFLTKKLGAALGVDRIGIESGSGEAGSARDPQQAALVIGKYLSPDLYVSYGIGLFDPVSTVKLQYTLSSKWKLATEASSVASGGDLIYTIERGE